MQTGRFALHATAERKHPCRAAPRKVAELCNTYAWAGRQFRVVRISTSPRTRRAHEREIHLPTEPTEPTAVTLERALAFERACRLRRPR
jgi:hypothetical protein